MQLYSAASRQNNFFGVSMNRIFDTFRFAGRTLFICLF